MAYGFWSWVFEGTRTTKTEDEKQINYEINDRLR